MKSPSPDGHRWTLAWLPAVAVLAGSPALTADADPAPSPAHLRDRRSGCRTSLLGTYVRASEWLAVPFATYSRDQDIEYDPNEFGFSSNTEYLGRYEACELVMLVAYGLNDRIALEFQAAGTQAS